MELSFWSPGSSGMQGRMSTVPMRSRVVRDPARVRWESQPWRRQLRNPDGFEARVSRAQLVAMLLAENLDVDAEVARFAGASEDAEHLTILQVLRFADLLTRRMHLAESDDQMLQLAHLRRNTEDLAERMIEWTNQDRL
ncbi:hypothetical protein [Myxococcus landrumensis]|uniref:Carrier domain-containing protein n=1 Tax=Myxococcus landrumensis TaxID=2813577 RepID=A0ABX7N364_9BACT|nr:hypothetical protein [Myxococcus landrumus]QSQ10853.1 hypothetical protein JY572_20710 [Myxococcus landrumus]